MILLPMVAIIILYQGVQSWLQSAPHFQRLAGEASNLIPVVDSGVLTALPWFEREKHLSPHLHPLS